MATEVGAAYVRLLPSMRGFTAEAATGLKASLNKAGKDAGKEGGEEAGTGFGSKFKEKMDGVAGKVGKFMGKAAKTLGVVGVAAGTMIGALGVKRLVGLENANKSFKQMGLGVKQIDKLMGGLLQSLRGTPYALNDGAQAMAAMVSAGAPLKKVNKYMDLIADSAAFAQKPISEVARVFQKIQSQGKIQGDEVMSLAEMGLPAFQVLSKGMNKSVADVQKIMKSGKLTADDFFSAWEKGSKGFGAQNIKISGAAKSAGDTTTGALSNMRASFGRLGEMVLGKPFSNTKTFFNTITTLTDNATAALRPFVGKLWDMVDAAGKKLKPIALNFVSNAQDVVAGIDWAGITAGIQEKSKAFGAPLIAGWQAGMESGNWSGLGQALGNGISSALNNVTMKGGDFGGKLIEVLSSLNWFDIGIAVGKGAVSFLLGFANGLLNTDIVGLLGSLWDHKWSTAFGILMIVPIGKGFGLLGKLLEKIPWLKIFAPLFTKGGAALEKSGGFIWKGIGKLGGKVLAAFERAFPRAGGFLVKFFDSLGTKAAVAMGHFVGQIVTKLRGLGPKIGGFGGKMIDAGLDLVFKLAKGMGRGLKWVVTAGGRIPGKVLAGLATLVTQMYQWGGDAVQGFINGLVDKAKDLPGVVGGAIKGGITKGLGWMGYGSPSKRMEQYGEWTTAGFVRGLKGTKDDIRDTFVDMIDQLKDDGDKAMLALVKGFQKKLEIKAAKKDAVVAKLDTWKEKLQGMKDDLKDFKSSIMDSFTSMGDVTSFEVNNFGELAGFMKVATQQAADWNSTVAQLQALGLKREAIDQLLAAGPETALKNAQLILSQGKSGVDQINGFMTQIQASGASLSNTLGSQFYDAGIASAEGIIKGLKAKNSQLAEAMKSIAKQMVQAIKKELGIKSPSRVFDLLGQMVPAGFVQGIDRGALEVSNSLSRMVATPELASTYTNALPGWQAPFNSSVAGRSVGATSDVQTKVSISAEGLNRALLEWLREAIRIEGGNVQKVLGKGNGS